MAAMTPFGKFLLSASSLIPNRMWGHRTEDNSYLMRQLALEDYDRKVAESRGEVFIEPEDR